jgi:gamma-glutamylcysteine synthetase
MDVNEKLDLILEILEGMQEVQAEHTEQLNEIQESIADLGVPGTGYGIEGEGV